MECDCRDRRRKSVVSAFFINPIGAVYCRVQESIQCKSGQVNDVTRFSVITPRECVWKFYRPLPAQHRGFAGRHQRFNWRHTVALGYKSRVVSRLNDVMYKLRRHPLVHIKVDLIRDTTIKISVRLWRYYWSVLLLQRYLPEFTRRDRKILMVLVPHWWCLVLECQPQTSRHRC